jgi:hypothetical protein
MDSRKALFNTAFLAGCGGIFSACENESRTIVQHHADLSAIDRASVPIEMVCGQAVLSFVSDPWLPAPFLFLILAG